MLSMRKISLYAVGAVAAILINAFFSIAVPTAQAQTAGVQAWVGARIIDGTGKPAIENATLVIRDGHVEAVGTKVKVPAGAERIDASGKTIIPGLINAHGHVNTEAQLGIYLRDGITTILSLGGDKEFALREFCANAPAGTAPRLYVAGPIRDSTAIPGAIAVTTPDEARKSVDELALSKPDIIKVRIDDFRGARPKMSPEVYTAVIDEAHKKGFRTAAHIVFLDDAKGVLQAGVDYIAHSVRDREVDAEFIRPLSPEKSRSSLIPRHRHTSAIPSF
jgi:imidazolonepropionase-like amidohydrolase